MQKAFLSSLSLLIIANSTIKSSHILRNQYDLNLAILPHNLLSKTTFQNIWFKRIELVHFSPITFNGCHFGSSSVFIQSKETLIIQNCINLSGSIRSEERDIFVSSSNLSENFTTFQLFNSHASFQNSTFTTKSNKPIIICSKSEVLVQHCNFSQCNNGGIVTLLNTNLTVSSSFFYKMKADEGAAINFVGDKLIIDKSFFLYCNSTKLGGALKISNRLNSKISFCLFNFNQSPQGNSIYLLKSSQLILDHCYVPVSQKEIYNSKKSQLVVKGLTGTVQTGGDPTNLPPATAIPSQSNFFSISNYFSQSFIFTRTSLFSPSLELLPLSSFSSILTNAYSSPTQIAESSSALTAASTQPYIERSNNRSTKYLTFVIIICAVVVIIAIVAVTAVLLQKRKSQIYPSDYDGEDEEPKKTTVVISNINDDNL